MMDPKKISFFQRSLESGDPAVKQAGPNPTQTQGLDS